MAEPVAATYRRLFDVWVLHHYWLDEGETIFDRLTADQRQSRLLAYDMRKFFTFAPLPSTRSALRSARCLFRETALGGMVAAPAGTTFPVDHVFEFALTVTDDQVCNYTSLTFRRQEIRNLVSTSDRRQYRYKENVPVLANLTGVTRGAGPERELFLSRETPSLAADLPIEALVKDGDALVQVTGEGPGAATSNVGSPTSALPVFVHQDDSPPIVAPPGVIGAPARGVLLSADLADDVFAVIRLTARRPDDDAFSFVDGVGAPLAAPPVYQIRFKNRLTFRAYRDQRTGALTETEPNALPLTYYGNAGTKQKPSRGPVKAEMNGGHVTRLISEIFLSNE